LVLLTTIENIVHQVSYYRLTREFLQRSAICFIVTSVKDGNISTAQGKRDVEKLILKIGAKMAHVEEFSPNQVELEDLNLKGYVTYKSGSTELIDLEKFATLETSGDKERGAEYFWESDSKSVELIELVESGDRRLKLEILDKKLLKEVQLKDSLESEERKRDREKMIINESKKL
jgi:hypothetical protein